MIGYLAEHLGAGLRRHEDHEHGEEERRGHESDRRHLSQVTMAYVRGGTGQVATVGVRMRMGARRGRTRGEAA